ncbi:hypothetical protein LI99_08975 [Mycolicibacterium smegmatis]|uniref:Uncharacterized protein n=2 Tax=Mycolicibacterium smegmatis (strain ATCC 700084 / mc(2)155) TaxID=246196 RepID=I7FYT8_MYCS2|nr:hypothetical protein MSMEG_1800 [Mycolicibacterium smegmatis MC2 155]AIU13647.1 hypothetical protein LI99_08975 [Mycolicibacterium smegmatis]AFP38227.1 hypothetical protein MSMEI_1755 [Mycolicibacterium smegmatis MC2 155]AIU07022.1 hypothetical protein LJ00_08975 [Mycolicibacterium smegmatis MC2 155]AIU20271.1 hypothetical protein LI98_08975 [Mycolicibacterium smegmatis]
MTFGCRAGATALLVVPLPMRRIMLHRNIIRGPSSAADVVDTSL